MDYITNLELFFQKIFFKKFVEFYICFLELKINLIPQP